jgi:tetratricopeptide (TPR) repeat protein
MALFNGLYLFEIVLMVLGVVLFVALLAAFLRLVFTGKPFTSLLMFFVFPIVMIAYPSIQSVTFGQDSVSIQTKTAELLAHPEDKQARSDLQTEIEKVSARPARDAKTAATLAQAHFALGNEQAAQENLQKALQADPNLGAAKDLQTKIDLTHKLSALTATVETKKDDPAARTELANTVSQLTQMKVANPMAMATVQRAQSLLQEQAGPVLKTPLGKQFQMNVAKPTK